MEGFEFVGGDNSGPQFAQQQFNMVPNSMESNGFGQPFDGGMQMNFQDNGSQMNNQFGENGSHNPSAQNWGFVPAASGFGSNQLDDDLDDEERERVRNAELADEERKRGLYDKM